MSARGRDLLGKATIFIEASRTPVGTKIVETDRSVSKSIVDLAAKENADLIVLGTQGTSGYGRLMLGSTAAGVVSSANCPVLAVR
jgi:nucleotide-binding universal stress UspA family protein